jgi:hypothetical protein
MFLLPNLLPNSPCNSNFHLSGGQVPGIKKPPFGGGFLPFSWGYENGSFSLFYAVFGNNLRAF